MDLVFIIDVTNELNVLNIKLQGQVQCWLWKCERIHFKTCAMNRSALSIKPLPILSMQGTLGCRHSIQWLEVWWCHFIITGKIWPQICRLSIFFLLTSFPLILMCKMPLLCFEWSSLTCSATLNSKPNSGYECNSQLQWAFPDVQAGHVPFWEHICSGTLSCYVRATLDPYNFLSQ